jgi:thioredoxin-related protein
MKKMFDYMLLILAGILIVIGMRSQEVEKPVIPAPNKPVVPVVAPLEDYIYDDEYNKVIELAKLHNKKIVLIFGADWCPHCKDLKKNIFKINALKSFIVCLIPTDHNSNLVKKYDISGLPTSVILDKNAKEIIRKAGYNPKTYEKWLNENK